MGKYLKVFGYILVLSVIYIWFSTVFNSCGSDKNLQQGSTDQVASDEASQSIVQEEEYFEEGDDFEAIDADEIQYEQVDQALAEKENKQKPQTKKEETSYESPSVVEQEFEEDSFVETEEQAEAQTNYSRPTSSSGQFMVIAGSFLVRSNAENMVDQLRNMGYTNAEIVIFDNSQFNTVIANRFNDYESAVDLSSSLKRKGIEGPYVQRKK